MPLATDRRQHSLTPELERIKGEIEQYAREYGLDFYQTIFEVLDFDEINMVASYGGFPNRYPHWKFGMEYERMSKSYAYGLHKIYEMVINNDPCYAYLLECNHIIHQKMVMAHVLGHCDFFKNNTWFSRTNRKMMDAMANHATRIRKHIDRRGLDVVESFIERSGRAGDEEGASPVEVKKIASPDYMDEFVNPKEFIKQQESKLEKAQEERKKVPERPAKDVLLFLIENAPLENWQRDILWIIRDEAYYFAPQAQTKIMNEGWATYWHEKIMTQRALTDGEVIDFADHHSGTVAAHPGQINPYRLGFELWKDIEDRWNKGKFGKEYDECEDLEEKKRWDRQLELGREKIFEVRCVYNDITFIDAFFNEEFSAKNQYFTYEYDQNRGVYEIANRDWKRVKEKLLFSLTNFGRPAIYATDANYENRGELLLEHSHEGVDLRIDYARETLKNLFHLWNRTVHLKTVVEDVGRLLSFDGEEHTESVTN